MNFLRYSTNVVGQSSRLLNRNLLSALCVKPDVAQARNESSYIGKVPLFSNDSINNKVSLLTESAFTQLMESSLISLHEFACLEWSSTIFLAAVAFRLAVCLPIKIYQEKLTAKMINLQPIIEEKTKQNLKSIKSDSIFMSPELKKRIMHQSIIVRNQMYKKENCQPQKIPIASLLQLPVWIFISTAIRDLSTNKLNFVEFQQMTKESFLWIPSLSNIDPHFIIPVIYAAFALTNLKYGGSLSYSNNKVPSKIFSFRKYLIITFILVITYLISYMPASLGLFWISSNGLHLLETIALDSIAIRRLFRIPKTPIEPDNIYKFKLNALLKELNNLKKLLFKFK